MGSTDLDNFEAVPVVDKPHVQLTVFELLKREDGEAADVLVVVAVHRIVGEEPDVSLVMGQEACRVAELFGRVGSLCVEVLP